MPQVLGKSSVNTELLVCTAGAAATSLSVGWACEAAIIIINSLTPMTITITTTTTKNTAVIDAGNVERRTRKAR